MQTQPQMSQTVVNRMEGVRDHNWQCLLVREKLDWEPGNLDSFSALRTNFETFIRSSHVSFLRLWKRHNTFPTYVPRLLLREFLKASIYCCKILILLLFFFALPCWSPFLSSQSATTTLPQGTGIPQRYRHTKSRNAARKMSLHSVLTSKYLFFEAVGFVGKRKFL